MTRIQGRWIFDGGITAALDPMELSAANLKKLFSGRQMQTPAVWNTFYLRETRSSHMRKPRPMTRERRDLR